MHSFTFFVFLRREKKLNDLPATSTMTAASTPFSPARYSICTTEIAIYYVFSERSVLGWKVLLQKRREVAGGELVVEGDCSERSDCVGDIGSKQGLLEASVAAGSTCMSVCTCIYIPMYVDTCSGWGRRKKSDIAAGHDRESVGP